MLLKTTLTLSIDEPCHEKWQNMTPMEHGAYCQACCKTVVDFSEMGTAAIISYFEERKGEQVCGRFRKKQLEKPYVYISEDVLYMNIPLWKKFIAILFICFSSFLVSCEEKQSRYLDLPLPTDQPTIAPVKEQAVNADEIISQPGASNPLVKKKIKGKKVKLEKLLEVKDIEGIWTSGITTTKVQYEAVSLFPKIKPASSNNSH